MDLLKEFEEWLGRQNKNNGGTLSASSAYKYARAINSVAEDMIDQGLFQTKFYLSDSIQDLKRNIELIKSNDYFKKKNITGHNMYSVALDHFLNFMQERK